MRKHFILICLLSLAPPITVHAQTEVVLEASRDNTLYEHDTGAISNGVGSYFFVGKTNLGAIRRAVLAFDVSGVVPAEAMVDSVWLTLNMSKTTGRASTITLHRISADWGEGTSDASVNPGQGIPATSGDATWLHRNFDQTLWQNAGGDFESVPSAGISVDQSGSYTWKSTPEMTADVRSWIDNPEQNFGWLLRGDEESLRTTKRFDSRENAIPSVVPKLHVFHSIATGTETLDIPTSVRLLKNYPNPFHQQTTIVYELERAQLVTLDVYDATGRSVARLIDSWQNAGYHELRFDAADLPAGFYVYQMTTAEANHVGRMIVIR